MPLCGGVSRPSMKQCTKTRSTLFCCANGETYNIPIELAESRYGVQIEQYAFHDEPGGAGKFRGGRGTVLDYRVTAQEAFLTVTYSRTDSRPWGLDPSPEPRVPMHLNGFQLHSRSAGVPPR